MPVRFRVGTGKLVESHALKRSGKEETSRWILPWTEPYSQGMIFVSQSDHTSLTPYSLGSIRPQPQDHNNIKFWPKKARKASFVRHILTHGTTYFCPRRHGQWKPLRSCRLKLHRTLRKITPPLIYTEDGSTHRTNMRKHIFINDETFFLMKLCTQNNAKHHEFGTKPVAK